MTTLLGVPPERVRLLMVRAYGAAWVIYVADFHDGVLPMSRDQERCPRCGEYSFNPCDCQPVTPPPDALPSADDLRKAREILSGFPLLMPVVEIRLALALRDERERCSLVTPEAIPACPACHHRWSEHVCLSPSCKRGTCHGHDGSDGPCDCPRLLPVITPNEQPSAEALERARAACQRRVCLPFGFDPTRLILEVAREIDVAVLARDREWCHAHGWREGAFGADGKPFTPERHAEIMREAVVAAIEEAVLAKEDCRVGHTVETQRLVAVQRQMEMAMEMAERRLTEMKKALQAAITQLERHSHGAKDGAPNAAYCAACHVIQEASVTLSGNAAKEKDNE